MPAKKKQPTPQNVVWKIRRKTDGLYSKGTSSYPGFSKEGRCWYSEKKLLTHLNMVERYLDKYKRYGGKRGMNPYLGCEIVQFKLTEEFAISFENYGV